MTPDAFTALRLPGLKKPRIDTKSAWVLTASRLAHIWRWSEIKARAKKLEIRSSFLLCQRSRPGNKPLTPAQITTYWWTQRTLMACTSTRSWQLRRASNKNPSTTTIYYRKSLPGWQINNFTTRVTISNTWRETSRLKSTRRIVIWRFISCKRPSRNPGFRPWARTKLTRCLSALYPVTSSTMLSSNNFSLTPRSVCKITKKPTRKSCSIKTRSQKAWPLSKSKDYPTIHNWSTSCFCSKNLQTPRRSW